MQDFIEAFHRVTNTLTHNKSKNIKTNEIIYLTIRKLQQDYLILPPSPTNIELLDSLKELYPDIEYYSNFDIENREKCFSMYKLFKTSLSHKKAEERADHFEKMLNNNVIIIKKGEHFEDFAEALKLTSILAGQKTKRPSQLTAGPHSRYQQDKFEGIANIITNLVKDKSIKCNSVHVDKGKVSLNFTYKPSLKPTFFVGELQKDVRVAIKNEENRIKEIMTNVPFASDHFTFSGGGVWTSVKSDDYYCAVGKHDSYHRCKLNISKSYGTSFITGYFAIRNIPLDHFYNEVFKHVLKG